MSDNLRVGALWRNKGKNGDYLAGELDMGNFGKVPIIVFRNKLKKDGEKYPDYHILKRGVQDAKESE